ncbi:glycosyltransferase family 4 protein [Candidatus Uhrbacteria bacterium]|nr:glycosyltransferase family 4 protein [Candidatus Uhrbacteria bacterium]
MEGEINLLQSSKPITYAIDAESANKEKRTGVEAYAFQVIQAMKQEPLKEGERVFLYSPTPLNGPLADLPRGWESRVLTWNFPRGWMQGRVSWELFRRPPEVLFVPAQGLPKFFFKIPIVTTIHDVAFRRIGALYDPIVRRRLQKVTHRSVKKASRLLAISTFTRQELHDLYHIEEKRVTITPLAADTSVYHRLDAQTVDGALRRYRLGQSFFLFVGRLEKKKNVSTLIRAFESFKQNRGVGDPFELVLVGASGFGYQDLKVQIERSPVRELIREVGYLPDEDVAALMNKATAFCFPSWEEGFGIPNVEAMVCGAVLVTSDIPVHHEVAGDAALFVDPKDAEAWAKTFARLASDPMLRDQLIEKGSLRAAQFSWGKTARSTWEVLRSLV